MLSRSLTSLSLISILTISGAMGGFAAPQSYEAYQTESVSYCDASDRTWAKENSLVPKIVYPAFDAKVINNALAKSRNNPETSNDEKIRIKSDLDPVRIGEYSGFKTLEIARVNYRTQMNSLFACGIVASRLDTLDSLVKIVDTKIKSRDSNIKKVLVKESNTLKTTLNTLKCNVKAGESTNEKKPTITPIINTASYQYCHYRHYLTYLDTQTDDLLALQEVEKQIGQGSGTVQATTIGEWSAGSNIYKSDMSREIIRADTTLPKAIRAYIEMDQTYGAHILLVLIYDDYIRLRKALSGYMNLSSQLYQKANNAQSTNK